MLLWKYWSRTYQVRWRASWASFFWNYYRNSLKNHPVSGTSATDLANSLREDLHQLALDSILEAMDIVHTRKKLEGADVDLLMYKLSQLEQTARILETSIILSRSISNTRKTALTHSFHLMEPVLRLDCVHNKNKWKALDTPTRLKTVKRCSTALLVAMQDVTAIFGA